MALCLDFFKDQDSGFVIRTLTLQKSPQYPTRLKDPPYIWNIFVPSMPEWSAGIR